MSLRERLEKMLPDVIRALHKLAQSKDKRVGAPSSLPS